MAHLCCSPAGAILGFSLPPCGQTISCPLGVEGWLHLHCLTPVCLHREQENSTFVTGACSLFLLKNSAVILKRTVNYDAEKERARGVLEGGGQINK